MTYLDSPVKGKYGIASVSVELEYNTLVQKFRPGMKGLQEVEDILLSITVGISSVLAGDTKCNVLLEKKSQSFIPGQVVTCPISTITSE